MNDDVNKNDADEIQEAEIVLPEINYCVFSVGNIRFSLLIGDVKEITDPVNIFHLPASPDYIKGLIHLRGIVLPVIDMAIINRTSYVNETGRKLIVVENGGELVAILTDGMPDLVADQEGELIDLKFFFNKYRVK